MDDDIVSQAMDMLFDSEKVKKTIPVRCISGTGHFSASDPRVFNFLDFCPSVGLVRAFSVCFASVRRELCG